MKVKIVVIEGQPTALFPDDKWDNRGNIGSYAIVGQHSGASPVWLQEPGIIDLDLEAEIAQIYHDETLEYVDRPDTYVVIPFENNPTNHIIFYNLKYWQNRLNDSVTRIKTGIGVGKELNGWLITHEKFMGDWSKEQSMEWVKVHWVNEDTFYFSYKGQRTGTISRATFEYWCQYEYDPSWLYSFNSGIMGL